MTTNAGKRDVDDIHFTKVRQIEAMDRRTMGGDKSDMQSELGIMMLLLVSGGVGWATESVAMTMTAFLGGLSVWLFLTLPAWIQKVAESKAQKNPSKAAPGAGPQSAAAARGATTTSETSPLLANGATAAGAGSGAGGGAAVLPGPDQVLALIRKRRSVFPKDYNGQAVPREDIEKLIEAANWAPTHGQTEPWRFVVLEGESKTAMEDLTIRLCGELLPADKAEKTLAKLQGKRASTWGKISCYIAVCCKRQAKPEKLMPEWEEMAATSCAVQNMALLATSMRIAAYWTSWQEVAREAPAMKEFLGMGPEDRVLGFFTVGRSDRIDGYRASRGPWADKVTWRS